MAELIAPHAQARGSELAIADERGETTWAEFDERSNRLIDGLRAAGLKTGDTIAILAGNRREYMEAISAATHAGWLYVPINWHWVGEEIAYVLENAGVRALLVGDRFLENARAALEQSTAARLAICVAIGGETPAGFVDYERLLADGAPGEPEDQAMGGPMFYTSGTTGRPKGVVAAASAAIGGSLDVMRLMSKGLSGTLQMPTEGRTLLVGPVYHSAQWAFACLPMLAGSAVVMRHKFDAAEALELVDRYAITNVHLVPTQFIRMLRLGEAQRRRFDGSSLEIVWHGAAPCPLEVKRQMIDWWGPKIWEYYGSTEGAIVTTIDAKEWLERPGSLGRPLPHMEVRVVGEEGSEAKTGEEGQLYIRNKMGSDFRYHGDDAKTDAAHLEPGLFTVGDVGSLDAEGYLRLSDRKIDMIISGGVNIYPAEIEGILAQHPAVADVAVFGVPNEEYGEEVKAAIELVEGARADGALADELIAHCRQHLAGYKAPKSVDFVDALPRHPTGKLYKRLLRDPYWEDAGRSI